MRSPVWILPLLTGCVLSVEEATSFPDDIHTIVVDVSKGDVDIEAQGGEVTLDVDFGGIGGGDVGHSVSDGVLTIDYNCGGLELCGGELLITAPTATDLQLDLGAGDLSVEGMRGDIDANLGAGSVTIEEHGSGLLIVDTAAGEVDAEFVRRPTRVDITVATGSIRLEVPAGTYALDLDASAGSIHVEDIDEDPDNPVLLEARAAAGSVDVLGR